jgi:hypothetical protein
MLLESNIQYVSERYLDGTIFRWWEMLLDSFENLAVILQGLVIHSLAKVAPLRLKFLTCGRPEVVWHKMATVSILPFTLN